MKTEENSKFDSNQEIGQSMFVQKDIDFYKQSFEENKSEAYEDPEIFIPPTKTENQYSEAQYEEEIRKSYAKLAKKKSRKTSKIASANMDIDELKNYNQKQKRRRYTGKSKEKSSATALKDTLDFDQMVSDLNEAKKIANQK